MTRCTPKKWKIKGYTQSRRGSRPRSTSLWTGGGVSIIEVEDIIEIGETEGEGIRDPEVQDGGIPDREVEKGTAGDLLLDVGVAAPLGEEAIEVVAGVLGDLIETGALEIGALETGAHEGARVKIGAHVVVLPERAPLPMLLLTDLHRSQPLSKKSKRCMALLLRPN